MEPLVLDIETLPLNASLAAEYPRADFSPPSNYKNPDAIDGWHERNEPTWRAKRGKECSLNPRLGRVLCLSTQNKLDYAMEEGDERALLDSFWQQALDHSGIITTWNGKGFDARFLVIRSLAHGIRPLVSEQTIREWFRRYTTNIHFDVKEVLMNGDVRSAGEGLDEWAAFFGLPLKPGVDGSDIMFLYANGEHDKIKEYCDHDRTVTGLMYEQVSRYFGYRMDVR